MIDRMETVEAIQRLLADSGHRLADDLAQSVHQQARTTKLDRRERCLAYLLEAHTADPSVSGAFRDEAEVLRLLGLAELLAHSPIPEVRIAAERSEKRLRHALSNPDGRIGAARVQRCVACGELLKDEDHHCDPARINRRDAAMRRDDTVA